MMKQAADIRDAVQPDEVLFVVDAMIGQDAVTTAQAFLDGVGYDGVVLTKLDGDARGGAALSIASVTGKPVMFASNGEKMTDFDLFHPDRMASRILDMGDVMTLIEQAEKTFDAEQAAKAAAKLTGQGGEFTLDDFLEQMQQVRKLGSMSKIMGMLPGMGQFRDQLENFDEREIDRIQAVIQSMTPAERANPKIIDGSRRARIAKGSGRQVSDVNQLVDRFFEARKMMMSLAKGGGMPGHARDARDARHGRQAVEGQAAAEEGQGQAGLRQPRQGRPAGRRREGEGRRRAGQPVRQPGRRRADRLREGRRRARPAQGLLQVPAQLTGRPAERPASGAGRRRRERRRQPAGRLVEGPRRAPPAGCTSSCWSPTCRTTWSCWCSRAQAKGGVKAGRDGHVRTVHAKGAGDDTIVEQARVAAERGAGSWSSPPTGCSRPGSAGSAPRRWARPGCSTSSELRVVEGSPSTGLSL